jgi:small GTP-binding protein
VHAARALLNLGFDEDCAIEIFELRGVDVCLRHIRHQNSQLRRLSIGILAQIASWPELREQLMDPKFNLVAQLVELGYSTEAAIVQEQIARCIAVLALNDDTKQQILDVHGTQLLIRWAACNRIGVQVQSTKALCNMLEDRHGNNAEVRAAIYRQGALQVFFTLSQIGDPLSRLQVIRVMRMMRESKHASDVVGILEFMKDGGITPLLHMVRQPPDGDFFIRVRAEAAHELCEWMTSTFETADADTQSQLFVRINPVILPLLVMNTENGVQSTVELRTEVLQVFDLLLHKQTHKAKAILMLCDPNTPQVRLELYQLWLQVMGQEYRERKARKRAAEGKAPRAPDPGQEDEFIHSQEFRSAIHNVIEMLRLDKRLVDLDDIHVDPDDLSLKTDDPMDLATKDSLKQMNQDKADAELDKNVVGAGLDKLQDQMMRLEVDKLEAEATTSSKKVFKVVVVGDVKVGKSSIIYRYCNQKAPGKLPSTMGCEYRAKRVERSYVTILLQIFDIQGHERYRKNAPRSFFKDAHGAIVVFDSAKEAAQTFYNTTDWKKTVDSFFADMGRPNAPCILLANKSDLSNELKFATVRSSGAMADTCRDHGYVSWHAVSAKEGSGLKDSTMTAFDSLIDSMLEWDADGKYAKEGDDAVVLDDDKPASGGCC